MLSFNEVSAVEKPDLNCLVRPPLVKAAGLMIVQLQLLPTICFSWFWWSVKVSLRYHPNMMRFQKKFRFFQLSPHPRVSVAYQAVNVPMLHCLQDIECPACPYMTFPAGPYGAQYWLRAIHGMTDGIVIQHITLRDG